MKRLAPFMLHFFILLVFFLSLTLLHFAPKGSDTIAFLQEKDYLSSSSFDSAVSESINDIFDYIDLRDLFETRGNLDLNHTIAQSESNGATRSYSLDYLIKYARSMGYYLNEKNEIMEDGPATVTKEQDEKEHQIKVTYRAYLPNYQPASPADGFMSLGKLAKEALSYLAKYYAIRSRYFDQGSNFHFYVAYSNGNNSTYYNNVAGGTAEKIQKLGKYLFTDSSSLEIKSNLKTIPSNVVPLLEARDPYQDGSYVFAAGVDTNFPIQDQYKSMMEEYSFRRSLSILGVVLFFGSILAFLLSFATLLLRTGRGENRQMILYAVDRLPLEAILAIGVFWFFFAEVFNRYFFDSLILVLGKLPEPLFFHRIGLFSLRYIVFLPLLLSLVRQMRKGILFSSSYCRRIWSLLESTLSASGFARSKLYSILLFVLPNFLGIGLFGYNMYCFFHHKSLLHLGFSLLLLFLLVSIDYYSYSISRGLKAAVTEQVKAERLKTDLITNVSHDLKTPLTSIISYVDLLKRENIENPRVQEYITVLEQKSSRLKNLTEDLVEASKASSGNITLDLIPIHYTEILQQSLGEFEDKLAARSLQVLTILPQEDIMILADGRQLFRVLENLLNNCCKYALLGSRIYIELQKDEELATFTMKNISEAPLNVSPEELTERFVRGDVSRSTEGSGLGLSIAKSLTKLMNGKMKIEIDGDLYKVSLSFPLVKEEA
jgi:integral membrane sensor signal transduction histidine kinase (fragment)